CAIIRGLGHGRRIERPQRGQAFGNGHRHVVARRVGQELYRDAGHLHPVIEDRQEPVAGHLADGDRVERPFPENRLPPSTPPAPPRPPPRTTPPATSDTKPPPASTPAPPPGTFAMSTPTPPPPAAAISEVVQVTPAAPMSFIATTQPVSAASRHASISRF